MEFLQLHRTIQLRILTTFITRLTGTMIFPFMAIYFAGYLGAGIAGILLFSSLIVQLIASLYGGYLADRWGRKKVMVWGEGIQCIAFLGMMLANSPYWQSAWFTFAMVIIHSLCNGLIIPASDAMLIDVSTPETRTLMYSINYWSINLAITFGALIGGAMFSSHRMALFGLLAITGLIIWLITIFLITETYVPQTHVQQKNHIQQIKQWNIISSGKLIIRNYHQVWKDRLFILFVLGNMLLLSTEFHLTQYIGVRLQNEFVPQTIMIWGNGQLELNGIKILSMIQIENTVGIVLLSLFLAGVIRRSKRQISWMNVAVLIYITGFAVMAFSNTLWILAGAMLLATVGELIHVPIRQSLLAQIINDQSRSSYMAVHGMGTQGARAIAALGITLGVWIPSYGMSILIAMVGLIGFLLISYVISRVQASAKATSTQGVTKNQVTL
ncbi:MDR family MFS transporter [Paenibacillus nuruki]|uniref:MDR family MFS transporter n=1 Tax=Paenibacillus nuruki TaxID=1886670 RepID=UPI0028058A0E|nr:MFS transporter [Paenibacillus nuruki]CAJ1315230.1 Putative MFS-type transporter YqjV [Paenibacillus nuruki]